MADERFRAVRVKLQERDVCLMCGTPTQRGEVIAGADVPWCWSCWCSHWFDSEKPLRLIEGGRVA